MEKPFSVAIDGPSGAGKSTIARAAARRFGFIYVDTGAIYRTLGLAVRRAGLGEHDERGVSELLPSVRISLRYDGEGGQRMYLGDEDVSGSIRTQEIAMYASGVSAMPGRAREAAGDAALAGQGAQRGDGRTGHSHRGAADADLKVFLTASPEKRAERRYAELRGRGSEESCEQVLRETLRRDGQDESRAAAPLRRAEDAVVVDTSELTLEESIEAVCSLIAGRLGGDGGE